MTVVVTIITTIVEWIWIIKGIVVRIVKRIEIKGKIESRVIIGFGIGFQVGVRFHSSRLTLDIHNEILKYLHRLIPVHPYFARIRSFTDRIFQLSDHNGRQGIISNPSFFGYNPYGSQHTLSFRLALSLSYLQRPSKPHGKITFTDQPLFCGRGFLSVPI
jgi:hypothetical protein